MYGKRTDSLGVSTPGSGSRSGSASPAGGRSPSPAHHPNYSSGRDERSTRPKYGMWWDGAFGCDQRGVVAIGFDVANFQILLGPVPNLGKSQFGDLLDPAMFSSQKPDDGPVSLRDMKKKNAVEKAKDPDRARVSSFIS